MKNKVFVVLILLLILSSCAETKYVTQVQHDTTTVYHNTNTIQHDSIYVYKDRNTYIKGDTVYTTITEYKDRWKTKEVHDTLYKDKEVYVDKEVPVYIEKELNAFQKLFIALGKILSIIVVGYIAYKLIKLRLWVR